MTVDDGFCARSVLIREGDGESVVEKVTNVGWSNQTRTKNNDIRHLCGSEYVENRKLTESIRGLLVGLAAELEEVLRLAPLAQDDVWLTKAVLWFARVAKRVVL